MCLQSTRIGQATFDDARSQSIGTTAGAIIERGVGRRCLMFFPPNAGRVTISQNPAVTDRAGIVLDWNDQPLLLRVEDHGDLVERAWHAIAVAGDGPVVSRWRAVDSQTNAQATATVAAVADRRHRLAGFTASTSAATAGVTVNVNLGATINIDFRLHNQVALAVPDRSIKGASNQSISVVMAAAGVGVTGVVSGWGDTIDAGDGGITIEIAEGMFNESRLDKAGPVLL